MKLEKEKCKKLRNCRNSKGLSAKLIKVDIDIACVLAAAVVLLHVNASFQAEPRGANHGTASQEEQREDRMSGTTKTPEAETCNPTPR